MLWKQLVPLVGAGHMWFKLVELEIETAPLEIETAEERAREVRVAAGPTAFNGQTEPTGQCPRKEKKTENPYSLNPISHPTSANHANLRAYDLIIPTRPVPAYPLEKDTAHLTNPLGEGRRSILYRLKQFTIVFYIHNKTGPGSAGHKAFSSLWAH